MLKKTISGFMLALFAGPLSAHAEMPGQPCTAAQIGTTKMADDQQNIIACLVTGKAAPQNVQEWKSMSSGGGGGITGGCKIVMSYTRTNYAYKPESIISIRMQDFWGIGCDSKLNNTTQKNSGHSYGAVGCKRVTLPGYSCGPSVLSATK